MLMIIIIRSLTYAHLYSVKEHVNANLTKKSQKCNQPLNINIKRLNVVELFFFSPLDEAL